LDQALMAFLVAWMAMALAAALPGSWRQRCKAAAKAAMTGGHTALPNLGKTGRKRPGMMGKCGIMWETWMAQDHHPADFLSTSAQDDYFG
jgi:hypothetical protein